MILTSEQLQQVKEMASSLLPPSEIALLLGLSPDQQDEFVEICRNHLTDPIYQSCRFGYLTTKYELRKTVVRLAKAGSPAAEPLADKYLQELKIK